MVVPRGFAFNMLLLLVLTEGIMPIALSSSADSINTDEDEQLHPALFEKHEGISNANISKRSALNFGNFSNYFQGKFLSSCASCGLINSKKENFLIIKGDVVNPPYKYPWMVRLMSKFKGGNVAYCGGSIIGAQYILTAAHCLELVAVPKDVSIFFLTKTHSLERGPEVQQIIMHPQYIKSGNYTNDIALLKLKSKIICDKFKNPICLLPSNFKVPIGTMCTAAGWGATLPGNRGFPRELREGKLKVVDFAKCKRVYGFPSFRADVEYCLEGLSDNFQRTASGDSGGPTFYERDGKYYQVGITSTGPGGTPKKLPVMHAAVPKFINWIKEVTGLSF